MDNRSLILETAVRLFSTKSYEGVGIHRIVEEAGVTKPTMYHYFGSKRGLMEAALRGRVAPFLDSLERIMRYEGDVMAPLRRTGECYLDFATRSQSSYRLFKSMSGMPVESESFLLIRPYLFRERALFEALFADIARDHGNIRGKYVVYAATFQGAVETYVRMASSDFVYADEDLLFRVIHQFMHGIFS